MPPVFPRRCAARFAELVDQPAPLRRQAPVDHDLADLADVADHLRHADAPKPDPTFRRDLRAVLMAAAERDGIGATATPTPTPARGITSPRFRRRTRIAAAIGVAAGVASVAGLSAASVRAVPGDPLYGMKRSAEQAHLAVTASDVDKGALYFAFARERMKEAEAVSGNPADIHVVLSDMDTETRDGVKLITTAAVASHNPAPLDIITSFLRDQTAAMPEMMADIDGAAHGRAIDSMHLLDDVQIRVDWLRADLSCTNIQATRIDDLGPKPQSCSPRSSTGPLPVAPTTTTPPNLASTNPANPRPSASTPTPQQKPPPAPGPAQPPPPAPAPAPVPAGPGAPIPETTQTHAVVPTPEPSGHTPPATVSGATMPSAPPAPPVVAAENP